MAQTPTDPVLGRRKHTPAGKERPLPRWARPLEIPPCPPGWSTGPPDFVGIGAQRSGTSWWYRGIEAHPGIATVEGQAKELHYFNRFWQGELPDGWIERYHQLFPRPEGRLAGEFTPRYMQDFWTPPLIREAAPEARLLVLLRDPVERFRSGVERTVRRSPGGRPIDLVQVSDALARGLYAAQLRRVLDHFPREQLLVLQFERCRDEPLATLGASWRFLGLDPLGELPESMLERGKAREKPELPDRWRAELVARLADDVRDLAALFPEAIDLERWPNFA
jgi:Sulfotransferase domain